MHDIVSKETAQASRAQAPRPRVHRTPAIAPAPVLVGEGARALAIRPLAPQIRLSLRLRPGNAPPEDGTLAASLLGMATNSFAQTGARALMRLGPDEWLLREEGEDASAAARAIAAALGDTFHALVDVSHRNVGFSVEGACAHAALAAGCPLDLAPAAFPDATATRTVLGKAEIVLLRRGEEHFEVECWRSFADYVRDFLVTAARDV